MSRTPAGLTQRGAALALGVLLALSATARADHRAVWRIPVEGRLDDAQSEQTQRRIRRAVAAGAGLIVLELRCGGGTLSGARDLAAAVASAGVETVAFVTAEARDLALLPALACGRLVMQGNDPPQAQVGGFGDYLDGHPDLEAFRRRGTSAKDDLARRRKEMQDELRQSLLPLAAARDWPAAVVDGMCLPEVNVVAVSRDGARTFLTEQDYERRMPPGDVTHVKPWAGDRALENRHLALSAEQAHGLGLADAVAKDFDGLCRWLDVRPERVRSPEAAWLDRTADFLELPLVAALLVLVGLTSLLVEFETPGVGLPLLSAAVCLVLFFWSHARGSGHVDWRALLLFAAGVGLAALEAFVWRGRVFCGVLAGLVVLAGLGLTAHGRWPRGDWLAFAWRCAPFAAAVACSVPATCLVMRYGFRVPAFLGGRPADEPDGGSLPEVVVRPEKRALLGAIGVAATELSPAGTTQFGGAFVDVVSQTGTVPPGARVRVVEVVGERVVVEQV